MEDYLSINETFHSRPNRAVILRGYPAIFMIDAETVCFLNSEAAQVARLKSADKADHVISRYVLLVLFWSVAGLICFFCISESRPRSRVFNAVTLILAGPLIWLAALWCQLRGWGSL